MDKADKKQGIKKISAKTKGLVDYTSQYAEIPDDVPMPDYLEDTSALYEQLAKEALAHKREHRQNARAATIWNKKGEENLKIILNENMAIAERLKYLLHERDIKIATFARDVGLGRTTIHRYLSGDSVPTEKKLLRIIDALSMSVADFCYSPHDTEEWKASLEDSIAEKNDIFMWRNQLIEQLSTNDFTYQHHGKTYRLPYNYYLVLRAIVENSVKVLDLLPHDTSDRKPQKASTPNGTGSSESQKTETENK